MTACFGLDYFSYEGGEKIQGINLTVISVCSKFELYFHLFF